VFPNTKVRLCSVEIERLDAGWVPILGHSVS
jgi:hypothetical protein